MYTNCHEIVFLSSAVVVVGYFTDQCTGAYLRNITHRSSLQYICTCDK